MKHIHMLTTIIWIVITLGCACLIAYFGRMLLAEELLTTGNQKMVFIEFARRLFPSFIAGVLMAAIMAASMSTADSQLLVASSSFTSDIYKPLMRKDATEKEILWVGRIVVVIVALIAFFIASSKGSGAQAIMNLIMILSPQRIILGGGVMHQEQLFPMIRKYVAEMLNGYIKTKELQNMDTYIVPASLNDDQGIMGCLELARRAKCGE